LDLVQKLLRLADTSRGATEHEAEAALAKAEELMTRHKIDSAMFRMSHLPPFRAGITTNPSFRRKAT
ncbi:MAG: DUF2786 domain-containing protein, partial [Verrucomicrobiaceae bacterium]